MVKKKKNHETQLLIILLLKSHVLALYFDEL